MKSEFNIFTNLTFADLGIGYWCYEQQKLIKSLPLPFLSTSEITIDVNMEARETRFPFDDLIARMELCSIRFKNN